MKIPVRLIALVLCTAWCAASLEAQNVDVTLRLDQTQIPVGGATTLRVFAQVRPELRGQTDRIFSWYLDVLNLHSTLARFDGLLEKPASDNHPLTSSAGVSDGPNRRGIYDTFMNLAGAGKDQPVELFSIPVQGTAAGRATFRAQAGTGTNLAHDFIVAPEGGGNPFTGGNYQQAEIQLTVGEGSCEPRLQILRSTLPGGANQALITYDLCPGNRHFVEFCEQLGSGQWQALPGGPHDSGTLTDPVSSPRRFYRLRVEP